jgi:hypothetical protein
MNQCSTCGAQFFPQSGAWGDTCGNCIAARIELSLMPGGVSQTERKPAKRANELAMGDETWTEEALEALQRSGAG